MALPRSEMLLILKLNLGTPKFTVLTALLWAQKGVGFPVPFRPHPAQRCKDTQGNNESGTPHSKRSALYEGVQTIY